MIREDDLSRAVEAILFASEHPLSVDEIKGHVGAEADVRGALTELEALYAGRGIDLVRRGDRWHFQTAADLAHLLRRDREESSKMLIEARRLYQQGTIQEAKVKAWQSQKLHGPYSIWDLGDRPQKLLEEIHRAEAA